MDTAETAQRAMMIGAVAETISGIKFTNTVSLSPSYSRNEDWKLHFDRDGVETKVHAPKYFLDETPIGAGADYVVNVLTAKE